MSDFDVYQHYEENAFPDQDINQEETLIGGWSSVNRFEGDSYSITSLNYDTQHELLWVGNAYGRLTSYLISDNFQRYSSFLSSTTSIAEVMTTSKFVLSISQSIARLHSFGGMPLGSFHNPLDIQEQYLTCGVLVRPPANLMVSANDTDPTHLIAGTSGPQAFSYDISTLLPTITYDTDVGSTVMKYSGLNICVGGTDGKIRLLDGRLRSNKRLHVLDAHTGVVCDIDIRPDDFTMMTCGMSGRPINPYDSSSPFTYTPDLVRIFDLRMNRQLPALPLPIVNTQRVRFLPSTTSPIVLLASSEGLLQTYDLNSEVPEASQIFYAALTDDGNVDDTVLTSMAVSSSGRMLAIGSSNGSINHFSLNLSEEHGPPVVNQTSLPLTIPQATPKSLLSLSVDAPNIGSACIMRPRRYLYGTEEPLLSSYAPTPHIINAKFKLYSSRRISDSLLNKASFQTYIGTVANPGFLPNSMIHYSIISAEGTSDSHDASVSVYAVCDPRVQSAGGNTRTVSFGEVSESGSGAGVVSREDVLDEQYRRVLSYRGKQRIRSFDYKALNSTNLVCFENFSPNSYTNTLLQILYLLPEVRSEALRSQANPVNHENQLTGQPSLWCELGFLFHMMTSVKRTPEDVPRVVAASNFYTAIQQCPEAVALGLLDNGNASAVDGTNGPGTKPLHILTQGFTRFLLIQLQKEQETDSNTTSNDTQGFHGKQNNGNKMSSSGNNITSSGGLWQSPIGSTGRQSEIGVIEKVFGYEIICANFFRSKNGITMTSQLPNKIRAFVLEMVFPSDSNNNTTNNMTTGNNNSTKKNTSDTLTEPTIAPISDKLSYSAALWHSMRRESRMRGWCAATESYEPLLQQRSLDVRSLSSVLVLTCGDASQWSGNETATSNNMSHNNSIRNPWQRKNCIGGAWLSEDIEIWQLGGSTSTSGGRTGETSLDAGRLVISTQLTGSNINESRWFAFDGHTEAVLARPASEVMGRRRAGGDSDVIVRMGLIAVISRVSYPVSCSQRENEANQGHIVLHLRTKIGKEELQEVNEWILMNELIAEKTLISDVTNFQTWRQPCVLFYSRHTYKLATEDILPQVPWPVQVPAAVFQTESLSNVPCVRLDETDLPKCGELVAFDAEFVTVELEKVTLDAMGKRIDGEEGRQILARISLIDGSGDGGFRVLADDCVLPTEPVLDYVTRFSGLTEEDLSPNTSRRALVSHRIAYLKLRHILDRGCVLVGHGLKKDFDTANIFVPPEQVRDTVELWRLPQQRKISLRFLAAYLLQSHIQEEVHDSIEDAKTALLLYRHYLEVSQKGQGILYALLQELYAYGNRTNWTIGADRLDENYS